MAVRLAETAERLGVEPAGRALLDAAFRTAMAPRLHARLDDHHADFLHPARTALILMDDAGVAEATMLAAAAVAETREPTLRVDGSVVLDVLGEDVRALLAAVPGGGGLAAAEDPDRLREDLVVSGRGPLLVAVSERLDHARHLHLRPRVEWEEYHARTCAAYAPAAARAHPRLEQRLAWWCRTFSDRFLGA